MFKEKSKRIEWLLYPSSYLTKKKVNNITKLEVIPCSAPEFSMQNYFENNE